MEAASATTVDTSTAPAQVRFRVHVTDELGVRSGYLYFNAPGAAGRSLLASFGPSTRVSGTERDGVYDAVVTVPRGVQAATWQLVSVSATDVGGNSRSHRDGRLTVTQTAPGDTVPPVLQSLEAMTPTTVDTSTGPATVRYRVRVTDNVGFSSGSLRFRSGSAQTELYGAVHYKRVSGTAADGEYEVSVTVPQGIAAGTRTLAPVDLYDTNSNRSTFRVAGTITQTGEGDSEPPVIHSVTALGSTKVDTCTAAATVRFQVHVTDDKGMSGGSLFFRSPLPDVPQLYGSMRRVSGTATDGMYEVSVTVPKNAAATTWTLATSSVSDRLSNNRWYYGGSAPQPEGRLGITNGPRT